MIVFAGPHQPAGRRRCAPAAGSSGRRTTRRSCSEQSPDCRLRAARAGPGQRAGAQRRTTAPRCYVTGSLPPFAGDPQHPGRRGPLPELGRRGAGAPRGASSAATRRSSSSAAGPRWARRCRSATSPTRSSASCSTRSRTRATTAATSRRCSCPFSAMLRDFPNKPPATPRLGRPAARRAALGRAARRAASARCARRSAGIHGFDPRDEEAAGIWDTVEEAQAFRKMTDGMKYFLGAVGLATLLHRRHRRDERDAGGGARAHARDRRAQGGGRDPRARSCGSSSSRR